MKRKEFYLNYIPALQEALKESELTRSGIGNLCPELFFASRAPEMDKYIDELSGKDSFLDLVGYYFDAYNHGFKELEGQSIESYRKELFNQIEVIKKELNI